MKYVINLWSKEAIEMSGSMFLSLVRGFGKRTWSFSVRREISPLWQTAFHGTLQLYFSFLLLHTVKIVFLPESATQECPLDKS